MVEIFDLTKRYGEQLLFEQASFNVLPGERIGLVGRNGHGKSTLLRIITGEEDPDFGRKMLPNNYRIGYLKQMISFSRPDVLAEASVGLREEEKNEIWKVKKILMGLGFSEEDLVKPPSIFSGGYQMRIELAKVLVSEPDMLLLDEPTNFLDIVSIRWLERFLKAWRGEFIIISHDRHFMDSVVTHILGIHRSKMRKMRGKTGDYYSCISREEEIHEKRRVNEEKKRKQVEEYISSFRSKARRAKSVQSSIKMLGKMGKIEKLDNIRTLSFSFDTAPFRAPVVMEAKNITFSYSGKDPYLINDLSLVVERGDKICIAGANGKGKTTLARILAGELKALSGNIKTNPQAVMAYYEQGNTARLDASRTVEDEILSAHPGKTRTEIRGICGAMMFSGDNALKKVSVLSGGERSRVLLAKTLLSPSNLLILDEPTHHLDMEACSALFEAVNEYDGAAIVVTHDEYFLHKVATKLIIFNGTRITLFPGNYSEFLSQIGWGDETGAQAADERKPVFVQEPVRGVNRKEDRRSRAMKLAARREKIGPLEDKTAALEKEIARSEKEHDILTSELVRASEAQKAPLIVEVSKKLNETKSGIERLYKDLERALSELERAKTEFEEEEF